MKIGVAYNYDPWNLRTGGGITYCNNLINHLRSRGHSVRLYGVSLSAEEGQRSNLSFTSVQAGTDNWWKFIYNLNRTLASEDLSDIDIVHTHHPLVMLPFLRHSDEPATVCTFHGVPLDWVSANYPSLKGPVSLPYTHLERRIIRSVNKTTTAGPDPENRLAQRHGDWFQDNNVVTPSGVDLEHFSPTKAEDGYQQVSREKTTYLFAGRLSKQKNLKALVDAFTLVNKEDPDTELLIVGTGEQESGIRGYSSNENIVFVGEVPFDEVPRYMASSDVFCLPSLYEASPTVLKESLACGTPVVSTDVGDAADILRQDCGKVVRDNSVESIAKGMSSLAKSVQDDPNSFSESCRTLAENKFSFESITDLYVEIFNSIV